MSYVILDKWLNLYKPHTLKESANNSNQSEPRQEADGTLKTSNWGEFNKETNCKGESRDLEN